MNPNVENQSRFENFLNRLRNLKEKDCVSIQESLFDRLKKIRDVVSLRKAVSGSVDWFRKSIQGIGSKDREKSARDWINQRVTLNHVGIGSMFLFSYDAKYKNELPYWDAFPLVIPIEIYHDGFLGINLHYLRPETRAILLDKLLEYSTSKKINVNTKLNLSYRLLKNVSKFREVQPCLKKYLINRVRSNFIWIPPKDWGYAIYLPVEKFQKKSKNYVWSESEK